MGSSSVWRRSKVEMSAVIVNLGDGFELRWFPRFQIVKKGKQDRIQLKGCLSVWLLWVVAPVGGGEECNDL